jgi:hypothetical protein
MLLTIIERNRFQRAPVLGPLAITDAALEALIAALAQRHGTLRTDTLLIDSQAQQPRRAQMIVALSRSLQALLADYDDEVLAELLADYDA